ncbi:FixH family protein [Rhizobium oryzicola]|uniref:FixH family protein n=1 Tax=Rhizobium oryzicola TaxID=1232668 RepID=A0ABT8SPR0_9HYPH|nr:FixH family protein [Rhizobium oryzicola]MDO1580498.1 FixH family protein [Rhizobium oryzicola]
MNTANTKSFVFTGWHMLGVVCLFFGTIITVNFYMAYQAVHSWSGIVVENTYVASQEFNAKTAEAKALNDAGVKGDIKIDGNIIRYKLTDGQGQPIPADEVKLQFKRPVGDHQDFTVTPRQVAPGLFEADHNALPGHWIIEASAFRQGKRIMHHAQRIAVIGSVQQ